MRLYFFYQQTTCFTQTINQIFKFYRSQFFICFVHEKKYCQSLQYISRIEILYSATFCPQTNLNSVVVWVVSVSSMEVVGCLERGCSKSSRISSELFRNIPLFSASINSRSRDSSWKDLFIEVERVERDSSRTKSVTGAAPSMWRSNINEPVSWSWYCSEKAKIKPTVKSGIKKYV